LELKKYFREAKMEKYILISVSEREIETKYFDDFKAAYDKMVEELDETGTREHFTDGEGYGLEKSGAWSNMNSHCNCDWKIEKLPIPSESKPKIERKSVAPVGYKITSFKHISEIVEGDYLRINNTIIVATSDAYTTDTAIGKEWNFECGDEYFYASEFMDESIEAVTLIASDNFKLSVPYVSVWDGGTVVTTTAKVDFRTGEVTDIEAADIGGLQTCEREYIIMNDVEIEVYAGKNGFNYYADLKNECM